MIPFVIQAIESDDDREFMEGIYSRYHRLMYKKIRAIVGASHAADDIFQAAIIRLINHLDVLRSLSEAELLNYIASACRNTAYNYVRDDKQMSEFSFDAELDAPVTGRSDLEDLMVFRDYANDFSAAWEELDERFRRVLELKYILDEPDERIASELGIKPSSVRMAISRARRALKAKMEELQKL